MLRNIYMLKGNKQGKEVELMVQADAPLATALEQYNEQTQAAFTIPGHHRGAGASRWWADHEAREIFRFDVTETPRTDDLHAPEGAIAQAQLLAAEACGADHAFFLVNGTTCGIEALLLAAVGPGQTVLLPRHAHKSALMGLILTGAEPSYVMPELTEDGGVGGISPAAVEQQLMRCAPPTVALLVHPTYDGFCSDLKELTALCHARGVPVVTDEAHGAHFHFCNQLPQDALRCGVDATVQSFHKTNGSFTQSAMLLLRGSRIEPARVQQALHLVQSTSPSYLLMLSLDLARREMALHGQTLWPQTIQRADWLCSQIQAIPGISCRKPEEWTGQAAIVAADPTRLRIDATALGLTGFQLQQIACEQFGIDFELADHQAVLAILSYAVSEAELEQLLKMLRQISAEKLGTPVIKAQRALPQIPPMELLPREAFFRPGKMIRWEQAKGRISAEAVIPYPPGIPVLCPGERITAEIWAYLEQCRRQCIHLQGTRDPTLETICVF